MDAEFWYARWERNEIGFHQQEINTHLQAFWSELATQPGETIFVPLCGKTRDMLWLRSQGYKVLGVEISKVAVEAFFREQDLTPEISDQGHFQRWEADGVTLLLGDFFHLDRSDLAEVKTVYDRAALVALPKEMRRDYVRHLETIQSLNSQMLLITLEYPQDEMKGPPFSVEEGEVEALFSDKNRVSQLCALDILAENPRFRDKGLTRFSEKVFRIEPIVS